MNNHWLDLAKKKKMYKEIDDLGMEVWLEGGTLGDLLAVLSDKQYNYLLSMLIRDFVADPDEFKFGLEIVNP